MTGKPLLLPFLIIINSVVAAGGVMPFGGEPATGTVTAVHRPAANPVDEIAIPALVTTEHQTGATSDLSVTRVLTPRVETKSAVANEIVFIGTVIRINGNVWEIDGVHVVVRAKTRLVNDPALGDRVAVIATRDDRGTFALEIETVF